MRPTILLVLYALALGSAVPAHAQADPEDRSEDTAGAPNIVPHGASDMVARQLLTAMRLQRAQRDLCWEFGCLVIVNESTGFEVSGFYVATTNAKGDVRWSDNQFGAALLPRRATFRFKTGKANCDLPVRFVVRNRATKEKLSIDGTANLCASPHVDSLLRINVNHPQVIVGG